MLTKSRFTLGLDCPTKLYYYQNKNEYINLKEEDEFLLQLAEGGFQVGALAKIFYPGGVELPRSTKDNYTHLFEETFRLLQQDSIIYEAAFLWNHCFIRADIIQRQGNTLKLVEVKAKSYSRDVWFMRDVKGETRLNSNWERYLFDVAFQAYVLKNALKGTSLEHLRIESYLLLPNKDSLVLIDGLNQLFEMTKVDGSPVPVRKLEDTVDPHVFLAGLGQEVLKEMGVDDVVEHILQFGRVHDWPFPDAVEVFRTALLENKKLPSQVSSNCKKCEYKNKDNREGYKDGFKECWQGEKRFTDITFQKPMVWEIWDFRKSAQYIADGKFFMQDIVRGDLEPANRVRAISQPGMSRVDRQLIQVEMVKKGESSPFVCTSELQAEMAGWVYPLHFIDFEGTRVALPFYKDMRPYEQIAFQFSHHVVHEDGSIEHKTEWINVEQGVFPNFEFVRQLKKALEGDKGTIFKYTHYENSVLKAIRRQLLGSAELDKEDLVRFIETITEDDSWEGERNMVDLCDVIKRYYYNPYTKGSNSIKHVLPAILNTSTFLQEKYSLPVYGTSIPSKNFNGKVWVERDEQGMVKDPYKLLGTLFTGFDDEDMDAIMENIVEESDGIRNGGAAMAAYVKLQFTTVARAEKEKLVRQLLEYCELDTLAMVMIWEELHHFCSRS